MRRVRSKVHHSIHRTSPAGHCFAERGFKLFGEFLGGERAHQCVVPLRNRRCQQLVAQLALGDSEMENQLANREAVVGRAIPISFGERVEQRVDPLGLLAISLERRGRRGDSPIAVRASDAGLEGY